MRGRTHSWSARPRQSARGATRRDRNALGRSRARPTPGAGHRGLPARLDRRHARRARRRSARQGRHQAPADVESAGRHGIRHGADRHDARRVRATSRRRAAHRLASFADVRDFRRPGEPGERGASRRRSVRVSRTSGLPGRALRLQAACGDDARFRDACRLDGRRRQPPGRLDRARQSAPIRQRLSGRGERGDGPVRRQPRGEVVRGVRRVARSVRLSTRLRAWPPRLLGSSTRRGVPKACARCCSGRRIACPTFVPR